MQHQCMDMATVIHMYRHMDTDTPLHMDSRKVMYMGMDMGEGTGVAVGRQAEAENARDLARTEVTAGVMGSIVSRHQLARMCVTIEGLHPVVMAVMGAFPPEGTRG